MEWFSDSFSGCSSGCTRRWCSLDRLCPAGNLLEQAYDGTGWFVGPVADRGDGGGDRAERQWPVEPVTDRACGAVDVIYTLIHRLGLFKLVMFFTFENWLEEGIGQARGACRPSTWDQLWPGVTDGALVSFLIYLTWCSTCQLLAALAQHQFNWWWPGILLHHSQRQMTMRTDNHNHLLDDVLRDLLFVLLVIRIGVAPGSSWRWWPSASSAKASGMPTLKICSVASASGCG